MQLSVIIPIHNDITVERCIDSIDENVEVVFVLNNPTDDDISRIKKIRNNSFYSIHFKTIFLKEASLSTSYDIGIKKATYSKIILMNADCYFYEKTIFKIFNNLDRFDLVRGKVEFLYKNMFQRIVSKIRHSHTNGKRAFAPPLGLNRKELLLNFNKEYFDHRLTWTEDFDFEIRRKINRIEVCYESSAKIFHQPISMLDDLKSAHKYGIGQYEGYYLGLRGYSKILLSPSMMVRMFSQLSKFFDRKTALYSLIWYLFFFIGFKRGKKISKKL